MEPVRWGVLSTARIGTQKVIPALIKSEGCQILALASRDPTRAQRVAQQFQIPRAYGSYEDLLNDPDVEVVYNPLPNHLHVPWTMRALEAGKHVLCEKPIALNASEAEKLLKFASQFPELKVMEAFMYRFHPQWSLVRELLDQGRIGILRSIFVMFSYPNRNPQDIRNRLETGGGGLLDLGCYAVSVGRWLCNREPVRVICTLRRDPQFGTDFLTTGVLDFESAHLAFTVSTQALRYQHLRILGSEGLLELPRPFNPQPGEECQILLRQGSQEQVTSVSGTDPYAVQVQRLSKAIRKGLPTPLPLEDAVANMRVLDALFRSEQTRQWEHLSSPKRDPELPCRSR